MAVVTPRIWNDDGDFQYVSLLPDRLDQLLSIGNSVFDDNLNIRLVTMDGLSIVAVNKRLNVIVGFVAVSFMENITDMMENKDVVTSTPAFLTKNFGQLTPALKVEYLGVQPCYRRRKIASKLLEALFSMAYCMRNGENVIVSMGEQTPSCYQSPKPIISYFLSPESRKLSEKFEFRKEFQGLMTNQNVFGEFCEVYFYFKLL